MRKIISEIKTAVVMTLVIGMICCGIYPVAIWSLAQGLFNDKANGSLIVNNSHIIGSRLLAQGFLGDEYFHPRPSAAGSGYDAANSGGSNLGPLSKKLGDAVKQRAEHFRCINNLDKNALVPVDAVTASASGLDPDISIENVLLQVPRVAKARGLDEEYVRKIIDRHSQGRQLGIFGEPRVNVLMLNLGLDMKRKSDGRWQD